jgi:hypothetical protein
MENQTEVPDTIPQMCKLGTVPGIDGNRLTLVACMSSKGILTARDGGIPRIQFFTYGPDGLTGRHHITAREVSRLNSLNATFAPANANPDILNDLLKYVFMMNGAQFPAGVKFFVWLHSSTSTGLSGLQGGCCCDFSSYCVERFYRGLSNHASSVT